MDIDDLGLRPGVVKILRANGLDTVEDVAARNPRELLAFPSLGRGALTHIEEALAIHGFTLADDPYAPYVCDREGAPRGDSNLASFIICEECAAAWQGEAFGGVDSAYVSDYMHGYCLNCNIERGDLHLYQWFLCGNCERVARSIGRSTVAARSVMEAWQAVIQPSAPHLELLDVDPPRLLRNTPQGRGHRERSADFIVNDTRTNEPVLAIEMKTGKSYIEGQLIGTKMARFQLDVSDCDEILAVTVRDRVPVYLMHTQLIDRAVPPTLMYVPLARWWTDPFAMGEHFENAQIRSRETRIAAYFSTKMFRRFDALAGHIVSGELDAVRQRLADVDWKPTLYKLDGSK